MGEVLQKNNFKEKVLFILRLEKKEEEIFYRRTLQIIEDMKKNKFIH